MSDNWVVGNLQNALDTWNNKLSEIWQLITQSPETFKGRNYMGSDCKYQWSSTSNWIRITCNILFGWNYKNLSVVLQK